MQKQDFCKGPPLETLQFKRGKYNKEGTALAGSVDVTGKQKEHREDVDDFNCSTEKKEN